MAELTNDKWINIEEAAEYLGVKPATIRDWIRKGKDIPAKKIGKQWKFKRSELDQWVQSGKADNVITEEAAIRNISCSFTNRDMDKYVLSLFSSAGIGELGI